MLKGIQINVALEYFAESNVEIDTAEVSPVVTTTDPYEQFVQQQAAREGIWKGEYSTIRKKSPKGKGKEKEGKALGGCGTTVIRKETSVNRGGTMLQVEEERCHGTLSTKDYKEQLRLKTLECDGLTKRIEKLQKNYSALKNVTNVSMFAVLCARSSFTFHTHSQHYVKSNSS